jgi:HlyD family secretion protein
MPASSTWRSIYVHLAIALAAGVFLVAGVGGWAATVVFSGAVIAPGQLVVETNVKKVQHPTGGVVDKLLVKEGAGVKAGDVVMRLDGTQTRANLGIVTKGLDELYTRKTRLEAERDGSNTLEFPQVLLARTSDPEVARRMDSERRHFELRREARAGKKSQLNERAMQLNEEIRGLTSQANAKVREIELIKSELEGVQQLWDKNLVSISRLKTLERDATRVQGEHGALIASIAQAKGKITETELQALQIDQDLRTEVARELAEANAKIAEYEERKVSAEDQLKRIDILAPQDGFVHQLTVHTVGGVVSPGEPIMLVVPRADKLVLEARVSPQEIDQVHVGQRSVVRFSGFSQQTTPELNGHVSLDGADLTENPKQNISYYVVRVGITENEIARLGDIRLVPGMPAEVFIQTTPRTVMSFFIKPLLDQINKAFREKS